jgi:hypothetical protein
MLRALRLGRQSALVVERFTSFPLDHLLGKDLQLRIILLTASCAFECYPVLRSHALKASNVIR